MTEQILHERGEREARRAQVLGRGEHVERVEHLLGGLVALRGIARERLQHDLVEGGRDVGAMRARRRHVRLDDGRHREELVVALEQAAAGDQLEQHDAEREHVGAAIDRAADALLGRHVRRLADEHAGLGLRAAHRGAGDAEVHDLHVAVVAEEDVRRRDIAVHDAERLAVGADRFVRVVERAGDGTDDRDHVLERHVLAALEQAAEHAAEVLAVDVLHGEVRLAIVLADVVDLDDVVVMQRGSEARFREEHLDERFVALLLRADPLDHEVALEAFEPARAREQ